MTDTYVAIINTPGYLPESEPATFDTIEAAWWHLYHERCYAESDAPCDLCDDTMSHGPMGDCDDDSETGYALAQMARQPADSGNRLGTIYGPTPGYRGDHDLGLAYSVDVAEGE